MKKLALAILLCGSAYGQTWYNASWTGRKLKAVDHRRVVGTLANFPIFIAIDNDADLAGNLKSACEDFLVTDSAATKLDHELLTCDATAGTVHAFVRIPSLSSGVDTPLFVYYGNSGATDQQNVSGVWDSSTKMVLNFKSNANDSTSNAINASVASGSPAYTTDSPLGPAISCSGLSDRLTTSSAPFTTQMTLSFWMRADMRPTTNSLVIPLVGNGTAFGFSWDGYSQWAQSIYFNFNGGSNPIWAGFSNLVPAPHRWYHMAVSWNGTTAIAYTDGGQSGTVGATTHDSFTGGLNICGDASNKTRAKLANITLSDVGRSAAWIATEYNNQSHPELFFRTGSAQTNTGAVAVESFGATYSVVEANKPTTLYWLVKNASSTVSINNGVGSQTSLVAGSVQVAPASTTTYTITVDGSVTATTTVTVPTTTVAYLRQGAPASTWLRTYNVDGSGHAVIRTYEPHNLVPGDYVSQAGFASADSGNTHFHASNLNGKFCVADIVDSTAYRIKDLTCTSFIDPNDTPLNGSNGMGTGATYAGRVTPTALSVGVRGTFDGLTGNNTRRIGTSTTNGLSSLVVSSGVATATFSYDPTALGAAVGGIVGVYGTTASGNLIGDHTITATSSTTYQFATTAADGTYTTNAACGPSGGDPHTIGGTDNCVVLSLWANSGNPNWSAIKTRTDQFTSSAVYTHRFDGGNVLEWDTSYAVDFIQPAALRFWVDRANQQVLNALLIAVQKPERYFANNFEVPPDTIIIQYGERMAMGLANPYTILRTLGHLSSSDKTTFAGKMLNDIVNPSAQCTRVSPPTGAGTVTLSGTTVTGSGTAFLTDFAVGDVIYGGAPFNASLYKAPRAYYISAVTDNTHMTVISGGGGSLNATPSAYSIGKKWATGQCGFTHLLEYESAWLGVQPSQYGNSGGINTAEPTWHLWPTPYENTAGLIHAYLMMVGGALADDDTRGLRYAELGQNIYWDTNFRTGMMLRGFNANGTHYGFGNEVVGQAIADMSMYALAPTLPAPDTNSSYFFNPQLLKTYLTYPDSANSFSGNPRDQFNIFGASSSGDPTFIQNKTTDMLQDAGWMFRPTSSYSKTLRSFLNAKSVTSIGGTSQANVFPFYNPLVAVTDYTTLPLQARIAPNTTQLADCIRLTGWNADWGCGSLRGDGFISKTSWTDRTAAQVMFMARSGKLGYDRPQPAALSIYALGTMVYDDAGNPPGNSTINSYAQSNTAPVMEIPTIGSFPLSTLRQYEAVTDWLRSKISRWAGTAVYGPSSNEYAYAMADMTEAYSPTYNRIHRHIWDAKGVANEHIIISRWDIDATNGPFASPPAISIPTFFNQNGETGDSIPPTGNNVPYTEGTTSCPGGGGCASLNTNRVVFTHGDGAAADAHGPSRKAGVIATWVSPHPITVTWDDQTYSGAQGHAYRATASSTGGVMDLIQVFKVTNDYTVDVTLTSTAINPNSNWTGVQTTDKVAVFSRGGVLRDSVAFTTTHAGTAQYLIAGLAAGTVTVTVGGNPVTGSPFTVVNGDNTVYFSSVAGAVSVGGAAPACSITNSPPPTGTVGLAYSYSPTTANCTAPLTWSIASGTICSGLSQNASTGAITGTPDTVQTCSLTIQVDDNAAASATLPISISISAGSTTSGGLKTAGTAKHGGKVVIK